MGYITPKTQSIKIMPPFIKFGQHSLILTSKVPVSIYGFCDHMMMVNYFVIYDGSYVKQNQIAQVTTKEIQLRKMMNKNKHIQIQEIMQRL
jgi:hypothetical protein